MSNFAIAIEYLTGYAVATDHTNREKPEWPPHPARVFMALAAAHFETDAGTEEKRAERDALEWLAALGDPSLALPAQAQAEFASARQSLTVYVPVNDATGLDVLPTKRSRQPRMFPRIFIGDDPIRLVWPCNQEDSAHLNALESLCRKVTRIGHSSSLVWVRLERNVTSAFITHEANADAMEFRLRTTSCGALERLSEAFNGEALRAYSDLTERAENANAKERKAVLKEQSERFPQGRPTSQRPSFSITRGYGKVQTARAEDLHSPFDSNLIVLKEADGNSQTFGLESTLLITGALRATIQKLSAVQPVPDWVSGHAGQNGPKLSDGRGHMAIIPLPFVGREHADGHLMGVAIALPREVSLRDRAGVLGPLLFDEQTNEPITLPLAMGRAGVFKVERDTSFSTKHNLRPLTWTEARRGWQSVTPVVLDRMPKTDRVKDRHGWNDEVAGIVAQSCLHQGLPSPQNIRVEKTPLVLGSLRAMPGQGGFPLLRAGTFQVHVEINFGIAVQGPILIGAGRFRGYGLCRPSEKETPQ